ncbi:hypothetical protein NK214_21315 [Chromobacterium sp. S0633]|uniref:hypothetical protein n=1 Tax=Chromobacterium sp. S0633 TaxID=2957805 RepID=UPI00209EB74C|nr:hypothetical protein [Chromobacterium sp. S0633]MCP1292724.1 hypothetical protein [Chromobacterium sp. S0633]
MIVRTWHGCVPRRHEAGFAAHLEQTGVQHSRSIAGNLGAFVRQEEQGEWTHFFLATFRAANKIPDAALRRLAVLKYCLRRRALPQS